MKEGEKEIMSGTVKIKYMRLLVTTTIAITGYMPNIAVAKSDSGNELKLDEIIVTAQKREQGLQEVPISMSAIGGNMMIERGMTSLESIQYAVPNFAMTESGISTIIAIRGISSGLNQAFEQSVGMYVDGIHAGRSFMARMPLLDLERVEVLRGPQSILFGKNSTAGALNITTAKPTDEFEGFILADYETQFNSRSFTGVLSGPLSETLRARVAVRYNKDPGYVFNPITDKFQADKDEITLRGTLVWDASDQLQVTLKFEHNKYDRVGRAVEIIAQEPARFGPFAGSGLNYYQILGVLSNINGLANADTLDSDFNYRWAVTNDTQDTTINSLAMNMVYDSEFGTFTSTTGYLNGKYDENCDCDFSGIDIFSYDFQEQFKQFSQELRLTSEIGEKLEYSAGIYFQTVTHDFQDSFNVLPGSLLTFLQPGFDFLDNTAAARDAQTKTDSWSAFAQGTWNMSEELHLTFGGRITKENKSGFRDLGVVEIGGNALQGLQAVIAPQLYQAVFGIDEHSIADSFSETKFSPSVNLQWDATNDMILYASWAVGYKSGGFDFRGNNAGILDDGNPADDSDIAQTFQYKPEKAINFEFGGKLSFLDGRGEFNFALYHQTFKNLQVAVFDGTVGFNVGNAASATSKGLEFDGRFMISEALVMRYSGAISDFKYDDYPNAQCAVDDVPNAPPPWDAAGLCDFTGRTAALHSKFKGTIGLDYNIMITDSLEFRLSGEITHISAYSPAPTLDKATPQKAYQQASLRVAIGHPDQGWELAILGQNLFNEDVISFSADQPLAFSLFGAPSRLVNIRRPRTFTLQARYNF